MRAHLVAGVRRGDRGRGWCACRTRSTSRGWRSRDHHREQRDARCVKCLLRFFMSDERERLLHRMRAWVVSLMSLPWGFLNVTVIRTRCGRRMRAASDCVVSQWSCHSRFFQFH